MNLTYLQLKRTFPEINRSIIRPSRILWVLKERNVEFHEVPMEGRGGCLTDKGREYVFLRYSLKSLLYHETLAYESVHIVCHAPAPFLRWRHDLQAEVFSLIFMMPLSDLKHLNRIKNQLDDESYELLLRRNQANRMWRI